MQCETFMRSLRFLKNNSIVILFIMLLIFVAVVYFNYQSVKIDNDIFGENGITSFSYLEDKDGKYELGDVQSEPIKYKFIEDDSNSIVKGQSRSVWWVHIQAENEPRVLTIINPTVEYVDLYLIDRSSGAIDNLKSGWGYAGQKNDDGFIYPSFEINGDKDMFLRLTSSYIQSYQFKLMPYQTYQQIKDRTIAVIGFFAGILIAVSIIHFLQYLKLKEETNLYFILHILMMVFYQLNHFWVLTGFSGGV